MSVDAEEKDDENINLLGEILRQLKLLNARFEEEFQTDIEDVEDEQ